MTRFRLTAAIYLTVSPVDKKSLFEQKKEKTVHDTPLLLYRFEKFMVQ